MFDRRVKINVNVINNSWCKLSFPFDNDLVTLIKTVVPKNRRAYTGETKEWRIWMGDIPYLCSLMNPEQYDLANLKKYMPQCESVLEKALEKQREQEMLNPTLFDMNKNKHINEPIKYELQESYQDRQRNRILAAYPDELEPINPDRCNHIHIELPPNCKRKPYPHQIYGAKILVGEKRFILADTMGLGKTLTSAIAAYNVPGRKLIICPASLRLNWRNELIMFGIDPDDIAVVLDGKSLREQLWADKTWFIINYDNLRTIPMCKTTIKNWSKQFSVAIYDEAHYCKTVTYRGKPKSERGKNTAEIAENVENLYLLTGTPLSNHTSDIYPLLCMVHAKCASDWNNFANTYCDAYIDSFSHWHYDGASNTEVLHQRLTHYMLRRKTEDVLQMPEKIRTYIPCIAKLKEYDKALKEYYEGKEAPEEEKFCALAAMQKMKQALAIGKVNETINFAKDFVDNGQPIVIYTCYVETAKKIAEAFKNTSVLIIGETSAKDRQKAIDDFQEGKKNVIVCTLGAGSVGITLTRSNIILFNDFDYVASTMRQAEDRIWRIGQKNSCSIFYVYADGCMMDEILMDMLNRKLTTIGTVVDGAAENLVTEQDEDARNILMNKLISSKKDRLVKAMTRKKSKSS